MAVSPNGSSAAEVAVVTPRSLPVRRAKRWGGRVARWAFALFLALLILPGVPVPFITPAPGKVTLPRLTPEAEARNYRVYVFTRWGYHSAIALEQPPGWRLGPTGAETAPIIEYAWGDLRYFRDLDRSVGATLAAVFLPTESTMYLRGWQSPPTEGNDAWDIHTRDISATQLRTLVTALEESFPRIETGERPPHFPGYPYFYPSREYYLWWNDCNAWTVGILHRADLAESPFGVLFCQQVGGRLKGFQKVL